MRSSLTKDYISYMLNRAHKAYNAFSLSRQIARRVDAILDIKQAIPKRFTLGSRAIANVNAAIYDALDINKTSY